MYRGLHRQILALRSRSALPITDTELKLMAAAAKTGLIRSPKAGYNTPGGYGYPDDVVDKGQMQIPTKFTHGGATSRAAALNAEQIAYNERETGACMATSVPAPRETRDKDVAHCHEVRASEVS